MRIMSMAEMYEIVIMVTRILIQRSPRIYEMCDLTWRSRLRSLSRLGLLRKLRFLINHMDLRMIVRCFNRNLFAGDPDILRVLYNEIVRRDLQDAAYVEDIITAYRSLDAAECDDASGIPANGVNNTLLENPRSATVLMGQGMNTSSRSSRSGLRRSSDVDAEDVSSARNKQRHNNKSPQSKNAVCELNELQTGATYKVVGQTGPAHAPIFTIAVQIDGQSYEGNGRSKKMAKHAAAERALRNIVPFRNCTPDSAEVQAINNTHGQPVASHLDADFTDDVTERDDNRVVNHAFVPPTQEPTNKFFDKSPVALINELYRDVVYNCVSDNGESYAKFTMSVTIDGETFEGTGPSKKLAKAAASKAALAKLQNVAGTSSFSMPLPNFVRILPNFISNSAHRQEQMTTVPQMLADKIDKLVNEKFGELVQSEPQHARRRRDVLAGIVQTRGQDAELICVTIGTKCVPDEHLSVRGGAVNGVNNRHAEVVGRRCLCEYLYEQLELHTVDRSAGSILESTKTGFELKQGIQFHLYVNTAP